MLHYRVPETMRAEVAVGSLVRVPVVNRVRLGIVGEIGAPRDFPLDRLKTVVQVAYPFPALTPELLELARWMARYYACGVDAIIETMIPAAVRRGALQRHPRSAAARASRPRAARVLPPLPATASAPRLRLCARSGRRQARKAGLVKQNFLLKPLSPTSSFEDGKQAGRGKRGNGR